MLFLSRLFESTLTCNKIKNKFIIHKHYADRAGLHYDLRIEHNCKLASWATRKLPDLINNKLQKIVLFKQPDHEPDWFDFEGEIDSGYGKGKVLIWDKGIYKLIKWDDKSIIIDFSGTKIKGKYVILKYTGHKDQYLMFRKK